MNLKRYAQTITNVILFGVLALQMATIHYMQMTLSNQQIVIQNLLTSQGAVLQYLAPRSHKST